MSEKKTSGNKMTRMTSKSIWAEENQCRLDTAKNSIQLVRQAFKWNPQGRRKWERPKNTRRRSIVWEREERQAPWCFFGSILLWIKSEEPIDMIMTIIPTRPSIPTRCHRGRWNPHHAVWRGRSCPSPGHPPAWSAGRRWRRTPTWGSWPAWTRGTCPPAASAREATWSCFSWVVVHARCSLRFPPQCWSRRGSAEGLQMPVWPGCWGSGHPVLERPFLSSRSCQSPRQRTPLCHAVSKTGDEFYSRLVIECKLG